MINFQILLLLIQKTIRLVFFLIQDKNSGIKLKYITLKIIMTTKKYIEKKVGITFLYITFINTNLTTKDF